MASDQVILPKDVLDAVITVRRTGVDSLLQELERQEPDFAEIVFEEISAIHQKLNDISHSARGARRIMRRTESLILIAVLAIRLGYRRLWTEFSPDTRDSPPNPDSENELLSRGHAPALRKVTPIAPPYRKLHSLRGTTSGINIEPPPADSGDTPLFRVVYSIDIHAADAREAAVSAHHIMSDPSSMAPALQVLDHGGTMTVIDLSADDTTDSKVD